MGAERALAAEPIDPMKPETGPAALTGVPPPDEAELLRRIAIRDRALSMFFTAPIFIG